VDEVKKLSHIYKASDNFQEQGIFTPPILKSTDCFLLHFWTPVFRCVCRHVIFELLSGVHLIVIILFYYTHLWFIGIANTFSMRPLLTILLINKIWTCWQCPSCLLIWFNSTFLTITLSTLFSTENWIIRCIFSQVHSLCGPLNYIKIKSLFLSNFLNINTYGTKANFWY
jgi:hypothetical protein